MCSYLTKKKREKKKAAILIAVPEEKAIRVTKRFFLLLQLATAPPTVGRTKRRRGDRASVAVSPASFSPCTTSLAMKNGPYYLHKCNYSLFCVLMLLPKTWFAEKNQHLKNETQLTSVFTCVQCSSLMRTVRYKECEGLLDPHYCLNPPHPTRKKNGEEWE